MKLIAYLSFALLLFACQETSEEEPKKEKQELGDFKTSEDILKCDCTELEKDSTKQIKKFEQTPFTGVCLTYYPDDTTLVMEEIQYLEGKIHGYYRIYSKDNVTLTEDQYVEGVKQKMVKNFTCDCDELVIEELGTNNIKTYLLNGMKFTGICEKFTKDGKIKILDMQFKDGFRHGNSLYYDQYGDPITADVYEEGKFVKTVVYTNE